MNEAAGEALRPIPPADGLGDELFQVYLYNNTLINLFNIANIDKIYSCHDEFISAS